jgi:hypothetical protein
VHGALSYGARESGIDAAMSEVGSKCLSSICNSIGVKGGSFFRAKGRNTYYMLSSIKFHVEFG